MRTSKLLSKKKIELFLFTSNLQFQHHIVLLLFLFREDDLLTCKNQQKNKTKHQQHKSTGQNN